MSAFADQYARLDNGVIDIPNDKVLRQQLFLHKVEHPAKNSLYLLDAIADYLTKPGDVICDPMAGSGSTMYVARTGRKVILIELSPFFVDLLLENREGFTGQITIVPGDCRKVLPILCAKEPQFDLIVFSPPYSNSLKGSSNREVYSSHGGSRAGAGSTKAALSNFTDDNPDNLGNMSEFWFNKAMQDVYQKCFDALKPGKHMVIIIKDQMQAGVRVRYAELHSRIAIRLGFDLAEWHQHKHVGQLWGLFNRAHGYVQVEEEDVLMFRRPVT